MRPLSFIGRLFRRRRELREPHGLPDVSALALSDSELLDAIHMMELRERNADGAANRARLRWLFARRKADLKAEADRRGLRP